MKDNFDFSNTEISLTLKRRQFPILYFAMSANITQGQIVNCLLRMFTDGYIEELEDHQHWLFMLTTKMGVYKEVDL